VRSPFGRARGQSRHLNDEPLLSPDWRHGQKKTLVAREQDRPDISRHRKRWRIYQGLIDPRRLVFIDETWTKTNMTRLRGWAPRRERLVDKVPQGKWKTATFLAALRNDRIDAPCLFDGPINGERFHAYVEQFLVPTLKAGDVVILDNLGSHKGKTVRRTIRNVVARLVFLPNTRPTSIRSSRSSPSSKLCCERREREATKPSAKPAHRSSPSTGPKNAPHTSGTQDMHKPKSRTL
jgi:putative transposase